MGKNLTIDFIVFYFIKKKMEKKKTFKYFEMERYMLDLN